MKTTPQTLAHDVFASNFAAGCEYTSPYPPTRLAIGAILTRYEACLIAPIALALDLMMSFLSRYETLGCVFAR